MPDPPSPVILGSVSGKDFTTEEFDEFMKYTMVDPEYASKVYHNAESVLDPPDVDTVIVYSSHIPTEIYNSYDTDPSEVRERGENVMSETTYNWGDSRVPAYSAAYPGVIWRKAGNNVRFVEYCSDYDGES